MRNKKLISFEIIEIAVDGKLEEVNEVLWHYTSRTKYLSMYKEHINDDTQNRLKTRLTEVTSMLCLDRQQIAKTGKAFGQLGERNQQSAILSPSIDYRLNYAVEIILSLIYANLQVLK